MEQVNYLNKSGKRAIRLDAWARDVSDRRFNTEMQNDTEADDVRRRARFYQGLLDTPVLKAGKTTSISTYRQLSLFLSRRKTFSDGTRQSIPLREQ